MSYARRDVWHQKALDYIDRVFGARGLLSRPHGIETEAPDVRLALRAQTDETSRLVRHKPDRLVIAPGHRTAFAEAKGKRSVVADPTIYVEWDSWRCAALLGGAKRQHCFLVLVDCSSLVAGEQRGESARACWLWNIPWPHRIAVPMRPANADWGIQRPDVVLERIRAEAAEVSAEVGLGRSIGVNALEYLRGVGSGTPFFSFQWRAPELVRLDAFIERELLGMPEEGPPPEPPATTVVVPTAPPRQLELFSVVTP